MHIQDFFCRNWSSIPDEHYPLGPLTLITGGNGSGKTTIADAIQTIMTAARSGLFQYNPGQDESSQQSRKKEHRTLASYVMGCDDGSYARTGTQDCVIGINFQPGIGEDGDPFCAMISVRASLFGTGSQRKPEQELMEMHLILGRHINLKEDLQHPKENRWLYVEKELETVLRAKFGKDNVESFAGKKENYLCRLYALMQGKQRGIVTSPNMRLMVKSFVRFMSYKPFDNINKFVRESVLEAMDNRNTIKDISSLMKNISELRKEADQIDGAISIVEGAASKNNSFAEKWIKHQENRAVLARGSQLATQRQYLENKNRQKQLEMDIEKADQDLKTIKSEIADLNNQKIEISAKMQGIKGYSEKKDLEDGIRQAENDISRLAIDLLSQAQKTDSLKMAFWQLTHHYQNNSQSPWVSRVFPLKKLTIEVSQILDGLPIAGDLLKHNQFSSCDANNCIDSFVSLEASLDEFIEARDQDGSNIIEILSNDLHEKKSELKKLQQTLKDLDRDIHDLKNTSKINYSPAVRSAISDILHAYPGSNPRILGDLIEVIDPQWQNAIEGFLGGARENILVDPEFETSAIRIVKKQNSRVRVIQAHKALKDSRDRNVLDNSIVKLMEFTDEYARAYMAASYGNVQQAESELALKTISRGLTSDGYAATNYTYFRSWTDDKDLVCGKSSREKRLSAMISTAGKMREEEKRVSDHVAEIKSLLDSFNAVHSISMSSAIRELIKHYEKISQLKYSLGLIDLSELDELTPLLNNINEKHSRIEKEQTDISEKRGGDLATLYGENRDKGKPDNKSIMALVKRLSEESEKQDAQADEFLILYVDWRREFHYAFDEGNIIDLVNTLANDLNEDELEALRKSVGNNSNWRLGSLIVEIQTEIATYNANAIQKMYLEDEFSLLIEKETVDETYFRASMLNKRKLERLHHSLKNNILMKQKETLKQSQEKFDHTFTVLLAQDIISQIEQSKRTLNRLNIELANHRFDDETFKFDYEADKEFSDYQKCFNDLMSIAQSGKSKSISIFENQEMPEDSRNTMGRLKDLLLQGDDTKAIAELERIADYRNYFNYEIYKNPEGKEPIRLSTYGTGSGGQLETPFYVIMAAAFQSAMNFAEGGSHLRSIVIDESFSKLDEKRSRRILQYLSSKLGLQVIFIFPTNKSGPFKNICTNQIVVQKIPDRNPPVGSELKTRVSVDVQTLNLAAIERLFEAHRRNVSQQVELDFLKLLDTKSIS